MRDEAAVGQDGGHFGTQGLRLPALAVLPHLASFGIDIGRGIGAQRLQPPPGRSGQASRG